MSKLPLLHQKANEIFNIQFLKSSQLIITYTDEKPKSLIFFDSQRQKMRHWFNFPDKLNPEAVPQVIESYFMNRLMRNQPEIVLAWGDALWPDCQIEYYNNQIVFSSCSPAMTEFLREWSQIFATYFPDKALLFRNLALLPSRVVTLQEIYFWSDKSGSMQEDIISNGHVYKTDFKNPFANLLGRANLRHHLNGDALIQNQSLKFIFVNIPSSEILVQSSSHKIHEFYNSQGFIALFKDLQSLKENVDISCVALPFINLTDSFKKTLGHFLITVQSKTTRKIFIKASPRCLNFIKYLCRKRNLNSQIIDDFIKISTTERH